MKHSKLFDQNVYFKALFMFCLAMIIGRSYSQISNSTLRQTTQNPMNASQSSNDTSPIPGIVYFLPDCDCLSTSEFNPVCGTDRRTYANRQKLNCARSCGRRVQIEKPGAC